MMPAEHGPTFAPSIAAACQDWQVVIRSNFYHTKYQFQTIFVLATTCFPKN